MISSPSTLSSLSGNSAHSDLFDQSALSTLAQRLVEAAKRAGADAADAVAVRGISQGVEVRDGRVEESERSEGDDVGLRVLVGKRQAVVSTNDVSGDGVARLAERAVAMARVAPDDKYVGLADPQLLARDFPDLDLLDPKVPSTAELELANTALRDSEERFSFFMRHLPGAAWMKDLLGRYVYANPTGERIFHTPLDWDRLPRLGWRGEKQFVIFAIAGRCPVVRTHAVGHEHKRHAQGRLGELQPACSRRRVAYFKLTRFEQRLDGDQQLAGVTLLDLENRG